MYGQIRLPIISISAPGKCKCQAYLIVTITDIYGRELIKVPYRNRIDISSLHAGMYFIVTSINGTACWI